jgi:hypothetical protein
MHPFLLITHGAQAPSATTGLSPCLGWMTLITESSERVSWRY